MTSVVDEKKSKATGRILLPSLTNFSPPPLFWEVQLPTGSAGGLQAAISSVTNEYTGSDSSKVRYRGVTPESESSYVV